MVKVKNVRPGIVIIADAGLKLGPGEVAEISRLTPQSEKAIGDGLLAPVDVESDSKARVRTTAKTDEQSSADSKQLEAQSPAEQKSDSQPGKVDGGAKNGAG